MSVEVYYNSNNVLTATLTKSSDGSGRTGATVSMSAYAAGSSGTLVLSAVSFTEATSGEYTYAPNATTFEEGTRYLAELTATHSTNQRFARVPIRVVTDAD